MINKKFVVNSAAAAFLALSSQYAFAADNNSSEKCYGVVKAGMNDCSTAKASCAGSSTKDNQADAFVLMPTGLCEKLVGGHLKPETTTKE